MSAPSNQIAAQIRVELRSILRQRDDLQKPLSWFGLVEGRAEEEPRYYVLFDQSPRLIVKGLRLGGCGALTLPDERIIDKVLEFAKSVWQLKDRLKLWEKANGLSVDIETLASKCPNLLICADLANWKKHGENRNRSGLAPRVELVTFDTSQSGAIELYHDGATKHQELLVGKDVPISYRVEVVGNNGASRLGNAVDLLWRGFLDWLPAVHSLGVLSSNDRESEYLRQQLFPPVR